MRMFNAFLKDKKVQIKTEAGDFIVPNAQILSAGTGDSTGVLIISRSETAYIANTSSNMLDLLTLLVEGFKTLSNDVIQATGGTSDVGGATSNFKSDMLKVSTDIQKILDAIK